MEDRFKNYEEKAVTCTWADDITVITSSHTDCLKVIFKQEEVSKRINLPLSAKKAQLLIIYPRNYRKRKYLAGDFIRNIKVLKQIKILGLVFQQPRFNTKLNRETYWYSE